jgi:hypothetical protein
MEEMVLLEHRDGRREKHLIAMEDAPTERILTIRIQRTVKDRYVQLTFTYTGRRHIDRRIFKETDESEVKAEAFDW